MWPASRLRTFSAFSLPAACTRAKYLSALKPISPHRSLTQYLTYSYVKSTLYARLWEKKALPVANENSNRKMNSNSRQTFSCGVPKKNPSLSSFPKRHARTELTLYTSAHAHVCGCARFAKIQFQYICMSHEVREYNIARARVRTLYCALGVIFIPTLDTSSCKNISSDFETNLPGKRWIFFLYTFRIKLLGAR